MVKDLLRSLTMNIWLLHNVIVYIRFITSNVKIKYEHIQYRFMPPGTFWEEYQVSGC